MNQNFNPKRVSACLRLYRMQIRRKFVSGPWTRGIFEFVAFGIKQAWACLFGGLLLGLILATYLFYPEQAWLSRYDFLVVAAVFIQIALLLTGLETWEEARVILIFHIVGTIMEIFKTHVGSWIYPEVGFLRLGGVPMFSGFMYAAVGSYIARSWRMMAFRFDRFPPLWAQSILACAIYLNFFTHHFTLDVRLALFVASAVIYGPTMIWFRADQIYRPMPAVVGLGLVTLFIWFAENIGTFAGAWMYPNQDNGWELVSFAKFGSWYLLMLISFTLVASTHRRTTRSKRMV